MGLPAVSVNFQLFCQTCIECGMVFGVPSDWDRERRRDHKRMFCPNGHGQSYAGQTEEERLRKELERLSSNLQWERAQVRIMEREVIAQKGLVTKAKNKLARTENGVCPECNRTFANVARHMQSKHGVECNKPPKGATLKCGL